MVAIYKITSPSDKVYIGQTWGVDKRTRYYKNCTCNKQRHLYHSLKKYGWKAHTFEIVTELKEDISQTWLDYWEQFFMDYFRAGGYKLLNIKEAGSRGKHAQETKDRIGNAHRGKFVSEEARKKQSDAHKGKKLTPDHRKNISLNAHDQRGPKNAMYGKPHTDAWKLNMSLQMIGKRVGKESPCAKIVLQFTKSGEFVREWDCIQTACLSLKINAGNLSACCRKRLFVKSAGGFVWRYKGDSF